MGSGPTISGGMSEEQYRQLQMDERAYMAEQEEKQMRLMEEMEDKRLQREQAEVQRQESLREKEEQALSDLEGKISDEVVNIKADDDDEDKDIVMDFYGSLAKNQENGGQMAKGNTTGAAGVRPK